MAPLYTARPYSPNDIGNLADKTVERSSEGCGVIRLNSRFFPRALAERRGGGGDAGWSRGMWQGCRFENCAGWIK
jgi:hypothetical protein